MPVTVPTQFASPHAGWKETAAHIQASEIPNSFSPQSNYWSYTILKQEGLRLSNLLNIVFCVSGVLCSDFLLFVSFMALYRQCKCDAILDCERVQ